MVVHFLLIVSGIFTFGTKNNSFSTSFLISSCMLANIHISTVSAFHFFVAVKGRHYLKVLGLKKGSKIEKLKYQMNENTYIFLFAN